MVFISLIELQHIPMKELKNAGLIESLGTEEINKALNNYYNLELSYYKGLLLWDKEVTDKDLDFWSFNSTFEIGSRRNYDTNSLPFKDGPAKRKEDLIKLIESTLGRNHLRSALIRHEHTLYKVKNLKITTQKFIGFN